MGTRNAATRAGRVLGFVGPLALLAAGCDLGRPATLHGPFASGLLAVGDVNGDGHVDIVTAALDGVSAISGYTVLVADGSGSFVPTTVDDGDGTDMRRVDLVDYDADGDLDLVGFVHGNVAVRANDGTGRFDEPVYIPRATAGAQFSHDATLGDVNGDGHVDIVEVGESPGYVYVRLGDGSGGYGPAAFYRPRPWFVYQQLWRVELADMDHDGDLDVVVTGLWTDSAGAVRGTVGIGGNDGTGKFTTFNVVSVGDSQPSGLRDVEIADVDEDGHLDVVTTYFEVGHWGRIRAFYGDGRGGLPRSAFPTDQIGERGALWFGLGDLTGDGHLDLVADTVPIARLDRAELFVADGPASWAYDRMLTADRRVVDEAIADLDGDGRLDLVLADDSYVRVFLNGLG